VAQPEKGQLVRSNAQDLAGLGCPAYLSVLTDKLHLFTMAPLTRPIPEPGDLNIWSYGVVYSGMKRLFALAFCVVVLGFVAVPTSKAQGISISIGSGGYCYPYSSGYGDYYGQGYGYRGGYYDPYYSGYSQQIYYSSGNPYGYRRSYYRRGQRYVYRNRDGYRSSRRHHHDWQD
jgi:hypothetical protein